MDVRLVLALGCEYPSCHAEYDDYGESDKWCISECVSFLHGWFGCATDPFAMMCIELRCCFVSRGIAVGGSRAVCDYGPQVLGYVFRYRLMWKRKIW